MRFSKLPEKLFSPWISSRIKTRYRTERPQLANFAPLGPSRLYAHQTPTQVAGVDCNYQSLPLILIFFYRSYSPHLSLKAKAIFSSRLSILSLNFFSPFTNHSHRALTWKFHPSIIILLPQFIPHIHLTVFFLFIYQLLFRVFYFSIFYVFFFSLFNTWSPWLRLSTTL